MFCNGTLFHTHLSVIRYWLSSQKNCNSHNLSGLQQTNKSGGMVQTRERGIHTRTVEWLVKGEGNHTKATKKIVYLDGRGQGEIPERLGAEV